MDCASKVCRDGVFPRQLATPQQSMAANSGTINQVLSYFHIK
jgi:hypothetical protein